MERLVESLGITRLSKSQVSEMARDLDTQVAEFRHRPLDQGPYLGRLEVEGVAAVGDKTDAAGPQVGVVPSVVRFLTSAKMWPVGWEALEQWGDDAVRIEPLTGGVGVNEVWSVRVDGQLAVGRLGRRSDADLAWETDLLRHLHREGMPVPVPIPATDGRHFTDGLVVMTYVVGGPPESEGDWRRVADTLRQLHRLTYGWPQRPGWRSSTDLLHAETGTKVDLGVMPAEGVARCRAAWARLAGRRTCVVHGDPNPGNIRMTADRVALIDWDESHVDVPDLDLALPHNAADLDDDAYDIAAQARAAWEAAVCWDPSGTDPFAQKRLAEVRAV
jgi:Phosphotransferase enzyme family/Transposase, Mutator family